MIRRIEPAVEGTLTNLFPLSRRGTAAGYPANKSAATPEDDAASELAVTSRIVPDRSVQWQCSRRRCKAITSMSAQVPRRRDSES